MRKNMICLMIVSMFISLAAVSETTADGSGEEPTRAVPTPPLNFTAVPGNGIIELSWDDPVDFNGERNGFNVYRSLTPEFGIEAYANLARFVYSFKDNNVDNGNIYYYAVAGINQDEGVGELTEAISAKPVGRPTAPRNVTATYASNQVSFTWLQPEDDGGSPVIGFSVLRGISSSALDNQVNLTNVTSYVDDTVTNGIPYTYRIFAFNERLDGIKSEEIDITPKGIPGAPGNLTLLDLDREVRLNWSYPEDDGGTTITGYNILRGPADDALELYFSQGIDEDFIDDNITSGQTFFYSVQAMNSEGNGTLTEAVSIIPLNVPEMPLNLTAEPRQNAVDLTWRAPEDGGGKPILGYNLYRTLKGLEMQFIEDLGNIHEYRDTNLTNQETYYYQIKAYNEIGVGYPSETVSAKPDVLPSPPKNFRVEDQDSQIKVIWTLPQLQIDYPVKGFLLYKGTSEDDLVLFSELKNTASTIIDTEVEIGMEYYYQIRSFSRIGDGPLSDVVSGMPFTKPGPIRDLEVNGGNRKVTISWNHPELTGGRDITSYVIFRGNTPDDMGSIATVSGNSTTYDDIQVTNGNRYFYGVKSINEKLDGDVTGKVEVYPLGPPTAPRNVATKIVGDAIVINWNPPSLNGGRAIDGYIILRGSSELDLEEIASVGVVSNYSDMTVEKGVEYYYSVKAKNEIGDGPPSKTSINMIHLPPKEDKEGLNPLLIILPSIIVLLILIAIIVGVVVSSKKKKEEETAEEVALEESDLEREKRLTEERRKNMYEYTDVSLTSEEAHAHDQDAKETDDNDLYKDSKQQEGVQTETPDQAAPDVDLPDQPASEEPAVPAPPAEGGVPAEGTQG